MKFEGKHNGVRVIIRPMTREQAREIFLYRPVKEGQAESKHCGYPLLLDSHELVKRHARPCKWCTALTLRIHLVSGSCPDCDGRSELSGFDPRKPNVREPITHRPLHITHH